MCRWIVRIRRPDSPPVERFLRVLSLEEQCQHVRAVRLAFICAGGNFQVRKASTASSRQAGREAHRVGATVAGSTDRRRALPGSRFRSASH